MAAPRLIVGLGNPGAEYAGSRHNAGFWLCEPLAARDLMQAKHPYTQGLLNCLPRIGGDRGPLPALDRAAEWAN